MIGFMPAICCFLYVSFLFLCYSFISFLCVKHIFQCVLIPLIFFFFFFLAALGLRCCTRAFSSCGEQGLLFIVVRRLLIAEASLVAEHGLQVRRFQQLQHTGSVFVAHELNSCGSQALEHRLSSCGVRAQLLCSMWVLPGPGIEPVSLALAGGFLTTVPPGKSFL